MLPDKQLLRQGDNHLEVSGQKSKQAHQSVQRQAHGQAKKLAHLQVHKPSAMLLVHQ